MLQTITAPKDPNEWRNIPLYNRDYQTAIQSTDHSTNKPVLTIRILGLILPTKKIRKISRI